MSVLQFSDEFFDELRRMFQKMDGIRGGGALAVNNGPNGLALSHVGREQPVADEASDAGVVVKVGTVTSAAGKYNGTIITGTVTGTETGSGALSLPDGLQTGDSCLLLVTEEDAAVTDAFGNAPAAKQRLMQDSYVVAHFVGHKSDGTAIVAVQGGIGTMTTGASTLNPSGNTADSTTWARARDGTPVNLYVQCRTVYDSTAGQLIIFQRELSYDARGLLCRVGPEVSAVVLSGC